MFAINAFMFAINAHLQHTYILSSVFSSICTAYYLYQQTLSWITALNYFMKCVEVAQMTEVNSNEVLTN